MSDSQRNPALQRTCCMRRRKLKGRAEELATYTVSTMTREHNYTLHNPTTADWTSKHFAILRKPAGAHEGETRRRAHVPNTKTPHNICEWSLQAAPKNRATRKSVPCTASVVPRAVQWADDYNRPPQNSTWMPDVYWQKQSITLTLRV